MPKGKFTFDYGMRLRGFSPGAQPRKGFVERTDDPSGKYFDIISYDRRLSDREVSQYELDDLNNQDIKKITKLRELAGLRQSELAKAAGISVRTLQRYELDGMENAVLGKAILIADALNCDVRDLLDS